VGVAIVVGNEVIVGKGTADGVTPQAARAKPIDDVPHNLKKARRVNWFIVFSLWVWNDARMDNGMTLNTISPHRCGKHTDLVGFPHSGWGKPHFDYEASISPPITPTCLTGFWFDPTRFR